MNVTLFSIRCDSDKVPDYNCFQYHKNGEEDNYNRIRAFAKDVEHARKPIFPRGLTLKRDVPKKNQQDADFTEVTGLLAISRQAFEVLRERRVVNGELNKIPLSDGSVLDAFINFPCVRAFCSNAYDRSRYDRDLILNINEDICLKHKLFRSWIRFPYCKIFPSLSVYCTEDFKTLYESMNWTGLQFTLAYPVNDVLKEIVNDQTDRGVQAELAKRAREAASVPATDSDMPIGPPGELSITWKNKPTVEQIAQYIWQVIIDERMTGRWVGSAIAANGPGALAITKLAAQALQIIKEKGVDANVLNHLARVVAFETVSHLIHEFDQHGIDTRAKNFAWELLSEALVQDSTRDAQGNIGGWPPA